MESKYIKNHEGFYSIYKNGKVFSHKSNIFLKPFISGSGYPCVDLCNNGKKETHSIHRLLGKAFVLNPDNKPQINHKDSNRRNYNLNNLEWATVSENIIHGYRYGNMKPPLSMLGIFGKQNHSSIKVDQYTLNRVYLKTFYGANEAHRETGVNRSSITMVCNKKRQTAGGFIWKFTHELQEIK